MDSSIPIGRWSIGLDGLLGLFPGFGDLAGALISLLIVFRAVAAGIPRIAIARMVTNIAIDTLLGSIPVAGDFFDFAYKSNVKNVRIYEQSLSGSRMTSARHWGFFAVLIAGLAALAAVPVTLIIMALRAL